MLGGGLSAQRTPSVMYTFGCRGSQVFYTTSTCIRTVQQYLLIRGTVAIYCVVHQENGSSHFRQCCWLLYSSRKRKEGRWRCIGGQGRTPVGNDTVGYSSSIEGIFTAKIIDYFHVSAERWCSWNNTVITDNYSTVHRYPYLPVLSVNYHTTVQYQVSHTSNRPVYNQYRSGA